MLLIEQVAARYLHPTCLAVDHNICISVKHTGLTSLQTIRHVMKSIIASYAINNS